MTAPTEQFTEFATKAQEQVNTAVRTWADALQTATDEFAAGRPTLADPSTFVEKYFDFAQQVLDKQREYAKAALAAGSEAAQSVTEQTAAAAKNVTAQAVSAVESTTAKATAATKR